MSNQTQLSTFSFENHSIRTLSINNEPWFIAKDICSSLNISNVTDALIKLDDDEKMILDNTLGLTESIGKQVQELNLVSESGMYTLILRCRDAVKKGSVPHRFRKWVTAEVLPQIRKTGQYSQNQQQNLPLVTTEADEEALKVITSLYHALAGGYELAQLLHKPEHHYLRKRIDTELGGHYIHNLYHPTRNALEQAKKYIHAKSERIMYIKGMLSLLNEPLALR